MAVTNDRVQTNKVSKYDIILNTDRYQSVTKKDNPI